MNLRDMNKDMLIKIIETLQKPLNERIKELEDVLKEFDIEKCNVCDTYVTDGHAYCGQCDFRCCETCAKKLIHHFESWNLSGVDMCNGCMKTYCHYCLGKLEEDILPCEFCESLFCNDCVSKRYRCCSCKAE